MPTIKIFPIDDSFTHSFYSDRNYGTVESLSAGHIGYWFYNSFLKFSLAEIPPGGIITSAILIMYCKYVEPGYPNYLDCLRVFDDAWDETTITWRNQPKIDKVADWLSTVRAAENQWIGWNVTSFVDSEYKGDKTASLCVKAYYDREGGVHGVGVGGFFSKDSTDPAFHPYLEVTYEEIGALECHAYADTREVGAEVEVVGVGKYTTPFTIGLSSGTYYLIATYYDQRKETNVVIKKGITTRYDFVGFIAPKGTLSIATTPVAGDIYVDGAWVGKGSHTAEYPIGTYSVSFGDVEGYYKPYPRTVEVRADETTTVEGVYIPIEVPPPPPPPPKPPVWLLAIPVIGILAYWIGKRLRKK